MAGKVIAAESSSPAKAKKASKRSKEIKQGKQREAAPEVVQIEDTVAAFGRDHEESKTAWPFLRLSEHAGNSASLPAVFSKDGRFCFVASGVSVKIYSVTTCQLLSSLNLPDSDVVATSSTIPKQQRNQVTSVFVNPWNSLQLVTTSLDGQIRIWDYLDGRVLRSIDMGGPISLAAMPLAAKDAHSDAGRLHDSIFVGVLKQSERTKGLNTIIYQVSLTKRDKDGQSHKKRVGKCKGAVVMQVSANGEHLVIIGRRKIHVAILSGSDSAFTAGGNAKDSNVSFISFDGFPLHWEAPRTANDYFTALSIHPTESYFATGDNKGQIRFWYILSPSILSTLSAKQQGGNTESSKGIFSLLPRQTTATVHWHAHGVSSLQFTPNGAYLLSGGEEAVLVLWQLQSTHKEFVPRLGGPINAVSMTVGEGREQEFVVRLRDGSISFVGAGTLKIVRSIAGVKSIADSQYTSSASSLPLAVEPHTSNLVFQASHPSSIQFFNPSLQAHIHELEISPSNRVSRTDERVIEPVRVEKVAFAHAASEDARVWMATFDTWQDREYTRESHLKFWLGTPSSNATDGSRRYILNTRIDQPHSTSRLSSLTFSPSSSASSRTSAKLATSSADGSVKIWSHRAFTGAVDGIWQCLFSFNYRSLPALDSAFSPDGSLLAVAHAGKVTLWNTTSGQLVRALGVSSSVGEIRKAAFVGKEGTRVVAVGKKGTTVWDILTCEEILSLPLPADHLVSSLSSDSYTSTFSSTASTLSLDPLSISQASHNLAFPIRELTNYSLTATAAHSSSSEEGTLAAISSSGEVLLTGPEVQKLRTTVNGPSNLRALANTVSGNGADRPLRLFDEIFGASALETQNDAPHSRGLQVQQSVLRSVTGRNKDVFAEIPSHRLPGVGSLAKMLLGEGLSPLATAGGAAKSSKNSSREQDVENEDELSDDYDQAVVSLGAQANHAVPETNGMDLDDPESTPTHQATATTYTESPASLSDIFTKSLALHQNGSGSASGQGTPSQLGKKDQRLAGSDRKVVKKKKSLSTMFGK